MQDRARARASPHASKGRRAASKSLSREFDLMPFAVSGLQSLLAQENLCGTTIRDLMLVYPFKVCLRYWTDLLVKALLNGQESHSAEEWEF